MYVYYLFHEFSGNWDMLIFSQTWPYTFCHTWTADSFTHTCNLPPNHNQWTIHGIWYVIIIIIVWYIWFTSHTDTF